MTVSAGEAMLAAHVRAVGLPLPTLEYRFHPSRRWRFDFAWPDRLVACEVEGGTFVSGRHSRGRGFEADCEKYTEAALAGWLVVRVTSDMVDDGRAITFVERALAARKGVLRD